MTTLGQYFKLRDDTCMEFVEQLKDLIRVHTFHELNQESLENIFKMNERNAIIPLASDRLRTLKNLSDLEIRETADPNYVNYCYRGVFIRYPKNQEISIQDLSKSIDLENTHVEVFYSTGEGSTDLSVISGDVEILIGKNEWYLYIAREIWNAFSDNYLESKLANSYKEKD